MCNQHVLPQRKNISKFNFRCWKLVVFYFVSFNSIIYVRTYWIGLSLYWFPIFTPDWYRYRIHMKAGLLWPKRTKKFSPNFVKIYENPFFNDNDFLKSIFIKRIYIKMQWIVCLHKNRRQNRAFINHVDKVFFKYFL